MLGKNAGPPLKNIHTGSDQNDEVKEKYGLLMFSVRQLIHGWLTHVKTRHVAW